MKIEKPKNRKNLKEWINTNINIFLGVRFPCLILLSTSFFVYIKTISPTIYWRDAPEFANVGYTLGIAHPSGSPTYSLISKIITFVPIGSIAFKINLVSLIFAVCSVVIIFKVILLVIELCVIKPDQKLSNVSALLTVLIMIFSQSFWMFAVTAEVYTMNVFSLCLIIYCSLHWCKTGQNAFLFLGTFLYGLSTGVHGGMFIIFPFLFLFFLISESQKYLKDIIPQNAIESQWTQNYPLSPSFIRRGVRFFIGLSFKQVTKSSLLLSFLFLLGFSIFLYLPIRSISNPTFDWGNPENFYRFINHITDRKDSTLFFRDAKKIFSLTDSIGLLGKIFINELTLIGFLCGLVGISFHIKSHSKTFILCFLLFSINILFYFTTTFKSFDFLYPIRILPSTFVFSLWIGLGIYNIIKTLSLFLFAYYYKLVFLITLSASILFSFLTDYNFMDKSSHYLAEENAKKMYLSMKPNSISFSSHTWFAFRFFHDVENLRNDIIILLIKDLENPFLSNPVSRERFPEIEFPSFSSNTANFVEFTKALIKLNFSKKHIYADFNETFSSLKEIEILPYNRFLTSVSLKQNESPKAVIDKYLADLQNILKEDFKKKDFIFDQDLGVRNSYGMYLTDISDYLILRNRFKDAENLLKISANLNRYADKNTMGMLGVCYINLNKFESAEEIFQNLLKHYPEDYWYLYSLGVVSMKMGKLEKAKLYLGKSISINNDFAEAQSALEQVNRNFNKSEK